jgi:hypothetical protein
MRFDVGLLDRLFVKRVTIQVPLPDGTTKMVNVTRRWLEKMERDGHASKLEGEHVRIHVAGVDGYYSKVMRIGHDIPRDAYARFFDPQTHAIYAMEFYEDGRRMTNLITRQQWELVKAKMEEIDRDAKHAEQIINDMFRNG